ERGSSPGLFAGAVRAHFVRGSVDLHAAPCRPCDQFVRQQVQGRGDRLGLRTARWARIVSHSSISRSPPRWESQEGEMGNWSLPARFDTRGGVVRWGRQGSGPPVVLLHGTPFSSVVWREVAAALAERHEVYVWDMLGYGQSDMHAEHDVSLGAQQEIFAD